MLNRNTAAALLTALLLAASLTACVSDETPSSEAPPVSEPWAALVPAEPIGPLTVASAEEVRAELEAAIRALRQPRTMEISALDLGDHPELEVRNLYYRVQSSFPELKYAYDLQVSLADGLLDCTLAYMPYKTGNFPAGFAGAEVPDLAALITVAEEHLGPDPVPVRITDPALSCDAMNQALQQVGGGYLIAALSPDATEIRYQPAMGMTVENCLDALAEAGALADALIAELVTDDMTDLEKAKVLYAHLTEHVAYDQRYYSDRAAMPYCSQTALGALRDDLAICGGYSHAVKLLYEKVGIPCYNVSGSAFGEGHMWNIAWLDGAWRWLDATADRGSTLEYGLRNFATDELDPRRYSWSSEAIHLLTGR